MSMNYDTQSLIISCNKRAVCQAVRKGLYPCRSAAPLSFSLSTGGLWSTAEPVVLTASGRVTQDPQREALHCRADPMGSLFTVHCCGWNFKWKPFG